MTRKGKPTKKRAQLPHTVARKPQHPAKTWQEIFLKELRDCGNVSAACAKAHVERSTVYKEKKHDDTFAEQWKNALDDAMDSLEAEAWRRARDGVPRLIFYKGALVTDDKDNPIIQRDYSDTLMTLLLKAHRPDKYRERVEATNFNIDFSKLSDEQLERIAGGEDIRVVISTASESGDGETPEGTSDADTRGDVAAGAGQPAAADSIRE